MNRFIISIIGLSLAVSAQAQSLQLPRACQEYIHAAALREAAHPVYAPQLAFTGCSVQNQYIPSEISRTEAFMVQVALSCRSGAGFENPTAVYTVMVPSIDRCQEASATLSNWPQQAY